MWRWIATGAMAGLLVLSQAPGWCGETGVLRVRTVMKEDGSPVPGVTVQVLHTSFAAVSDVNGRVVWRAMPPGMYTVTCELEGFGRVVVEQVAVRPDSVATIRCEMVPQAAEVIEVHGAPLVDPTNPATYHYIDRASSKNSIPPDIFSQAKLLPGVVQNGEILDYVFIRGTPQRATALSVEGVDVRNAVHLTTGVPVFAKGALEGIEVATGSLAPEFGNVLGGVLNSVVATGEGEPTFYGDISFTSTEAAAFDETSRERNQGLLQAELGWNPNDRWGFKIAFANYAGDAMPWTFEINDNFVDFYDLWLIGRWQPNPKLRIKAVYERARGTVRFHSGPTQEGRLVPRIFWQTRPHDNDLALVSWNYQPNADWVLAGQFSFLETYDGAGPTFDGDRDFLTADQVLDQALRSGREGRLWDYWTDITFYRSRRVQARFSLTGFRWSGHIVKSVLDLQYLSIPEGYFLNAQPVWAAAVLGCPGGRACPLPPFVQPQDLALWVDYQGNGYQFGWSIQDTWTLTKGLRLLFGARIDYWSYMERSLQVSPRLTLTWQPAASTVVKIGGGRFAQPVPPAAAFLTERNRFTWISGLFPQLIGPDSVWTRRYVTNPDACRANLLFCRPGVTELGPETSWSVDFEWDQMLTPAIGFRVSAYYKRMQDMLFNGRGFRHPLGQDVKQQFPEALVNGGEGRAYGIEISLARLRGNLTGWIAYTYAVAEGTFPSADYRGGGILTGDFRPLNFDIRHQIQVVLNGHTDWLGGWDLNTTLRWNTGYPATQRYWRLWTCNLTNIGLPPAGATPIGPEGCIYIPDRDPATGQQRVGLFNDVRMPDFLKWDLKIEKTLVHFHDRGRVNLVGIVENLLDHKNYGTWTTEQNSFREIDAESGQVIAEGARLAERRFQFGLRVFW